MIEDWVFEENAAPLMRVLSTLVGYEWDQWDHDALAGGLAESDGESGQWFAYPLGETPAIDVRLARDPGTAVVRFRIEAPGDLHDRIELAITIAQEFELQPRQP